MQLKPDALHHLAEALAEDVLATSARDLRDEVAEDFGEQDALVCGFDEALAKHDATTEASASADAVWRFTDGLSEDVATAPPETLLADVAHDFGDPQALAREFDAVVHHTISVPPLLVPARNRSERPRLTDTALPALRRLFAMPLARRSALGACAAAVLAAILLPDLYEAVREESASLPAAPAPAAGGANVADAQRPDQVKCLAPCGVATKVVADVSAPPPPQQAYASPSLAAAPAAAKPSIPPGSSPLLETDAVRKVAPTPTTTVPATPPVTSRFGEVGQNSLPAFAAPRAMTPAAAPEPAGQSGGQIAARGAVGEAQRGIPAAAVPPPQETKQRVQVLIAPESEQLFKANCSACHRSPQGLAKNRDARALSEFLRKHVDRPDVVEALATYVSKFNARGSAREQAGGRRN